MSDVAIRMSRLFDPRSGRCFDVAVDHGFFGEASFLTGIEDLGAALKDSLDELVEAAGGRTTKPRRQAATPRKLEPA